MLAWKTGVMHLKTISRGTAVSYGGAWVAARPSVIATLPIGYADGFSRVYSGRASVLVRGKRAKVVGRVTMDMCMVDVTEIADVKVGDEVVILGAQGNERIDAEGAGRARADAALRSALQPRRTGAKAARRPRLGVRGDFAVDRVAADLLVRAVVAARDPDDLPFREHDRGQPPPKTAPVSMPTACSVTSGATVARCDRRSPALASDLCSPRT